MLKNILNLEGAQQLTNEAQKEINGGGVMGPKGCDYIYIVWPHTQAECDDFEGVYNPATGKCAYTYCIC